MTPSGKRIAEIRRKAANLTELGLEDVRQHEAIIQARPRGREVRDEFRRHHGNGCTLVEHPDGKFDLTITDAKLKWKWRDMQQKARRLSAERAAVVRSRQQRLTVRGRHGRKVEIHAANEKALARGISSTKTTFTRGLPRCQRSDSARHSYRNGRCEWCGRKRDGTR